MPIVDGLTSTKMIREYEKSPEQKSHSLLDGAARRVPILAVSASLVEEQLQTYVDAGFDGWILKPIDFKRLHTLLKGIHDAEVRRECLYVPGEWERGGWFPRSRTTESYGSDEITPKADEENKELVAAATTTEAGDETRETPSAERDQ
jgi:CheY-like chemotaxis protein